MHVPRLRRPRPVGRLSRQGVTLQHDDVLEVIGSAAAAVNPPIPAPTTTACSPMGVDMITTSGAQ